MMYVAPWGNKRAPIAHDCVLLCEWINTATARLCDDAHTRVAREITDHFNASVEGKVVAGLSRDNAEREALAALGPPRAARRVLCRSNLTKQEAQTLQLIQGKTVPGVANASAMASRHGGLAIFCVGMYLLLQLGGGMDSGALLAMQFPWIPLWLGVRIYKSRPARPLRDTVWLMNLFQCALGSLLLVALTRGALSCLAADKTGEFVCNLLAIVGVFISFWQCWRLWSKLPKAQGPVQS